MVHNKMLLRFVHFDIGCVYKHCITLEM